MPLSPSPLRLPRASLAIPAFTAIGTYPRKSFASQECIERVFSAAFLLPVLHVIFAYPMRWPLLALALVSLGTATLELWILFQKALALHAARSAGISKFGFVHSRAYLVLLATAISCGIIATGALVFLNCDIWPAMEVLFCLCMVNEIGGFCAGRFFVCPTSAYFAPSISPNKTWRGVCAGAACTAVAAALVHMYFSRNPFAEELSLLRVLLLGAKIGLIETCGDLAVSALKRQAGVKDTALSWSRIPGHGGIMDRLDGPCMVCAWQLFVHTWFDNTLYGVCLYSLLD